MAYIQPTYKTSNKVTERYLIDTYGFKKSMYGTILRFPVYKYKNKPLIFAEFIFDNDENQISIRAIDDKGNIHNYNKEEYGRSDVITCINKELWKTINKLIEGGVIC